MKNRIIILLECLLFCCLASCHNNIVYSPYFKCSEILNEPYGICSHINRTGNRYEFESRDYDISMISQTGAKWVRTDFDYSTLLDGGNERNFSYNRFDTMIRSTYENKLKILGIIAPPGGISKYNRREKYIDSIVKRYNNVVTSWEIINEVDKKINRKKRGWLNAEEYVKLLKMAHSSIKSNNKDAIVIFSGLSNINSNIVDSVFCHDVNSYFDIMNIHRYCNKSREPEKMIETFEEIRLKMQKYNIDKPLWLTECGTSTAKGWSTEKIQAQRLPRIFLISFACGADKVFWYKSRSNELSDDRDCHFGLWHKDYAPKLAFYTFQTLTKMCPDGSTRPQLKNNDGIFIAKWKRPDGKNVWALWTSKSHVQSTLVIKGRFRAYNDHGENLKMSPTSEINITPSVIYILGANNVLVDS